MTTPLDVTTLYDFIKKLNPNGEGFVSMKGFLDAASGFYGCTPLTVRNFVKSHSEFFEFQHGLIRLKKLETYERQVADTEDYSAWVADREKLLDECVQFLKYQTPSPLIENILVRAASAREELKSYNDSKLLDLLMDLKREFSYSPTKTLSGSM